MSIFTAVAAALASLSPAVPYAMDTYLTDDGADLPAQFIVYQLLNGSPEQHADNAETHRTFMVQISICSTSGLASLPDVDAAMLAAGFVRGAERMLPKDNNTGHFILAKDYFLMQ